ENAQPDAAAEQIACTRFAANPPRRAEAQDEDDAVRHTPGQVRRQHTRRPVAGACAVVEVAGPHHRDHRAFDEHEENGHEPHRIAWAEDDRRQRRDVERRAFAQSLHTSVAFLCCVSRHLGQYQPIRVMITGIDVYSTDFALKTEPTKRPVIAMAAQNGHALGSGESILESGSPSSESVISTSRMSSRTPVTIG